MKNTLCGMCVRKQQTHLQQKNDNQIISKFLTYNYENQEKT